MVAMHSAVLTGTVDFSTTIFTPLVTYSAILLATASTYFRSAALPLPSPEVFVGVLTLIKIMSASIMAS